MVFRRTAEPHGRPAARVRRAAAEIALIVALFVVYEHVRYITRDDAGQAMTNADRVVAAERSAHVFLEPHVQRLALRSTHVVEWLNRYYVGVHFPLTAAFVVWVLVRHHGWYPRIRTWLIATTAAGLAIHVAFPLAPPRMLPDEGIVDTLRVYGPNIYPADTTQSVANQFAAMPSLHFGWALLVAGGVIAIHRTRTSWLAAAHPLLTLVAIVATGNHYLVDALVAAIVVVPAGLLAGVHRRVPRPQRFDSDSPPRSRTIATVTTTHERTR